MLILKENILYLLNFSQHIIQAIYNGCTEMGATFLLKLPKKKKRMKKLSVVGMLKFIHLNVLISFYSTPDVPL
jgi:hypothetical protein